MALPAGQALLGVPFKMRQSATKAGTSKSLVCEGVWLRGLDLNQRPLGYEGH
jgi:hypothetical protein